MIYMRPGPSKTLKAEFAGAIKAALHDVYPDVNPDDLSLESTMSIPKQGGSDLASSVAFRLSKALGKSPKDIAHSLSSQLGATRHIRRYRA